MQITVTWENGEIFQRFGHTAQFKVHVAIGSAAHPMIPEHSIQWVSSFRGLQLTSLFLLAYSPFRLQLLKLSVYTHGWALRMKDCFPAWALPVQADD